MVLEKRIRIFLAAFFFASFTQKVIASHVCTEEQEKAYAQAIAVLEPRSKPAAYDERVVKKKGKDWVKSVGEIAMAKEGVSFPYSYYRSLRVPKGEKAPLVFVYPGIGGPTILDRHIAHHYAKRGVSVVISHYFDKAAAEKLENIPIIFSNTVKQSLVLTDYFSSRPEIDPNRLAVLGISYGGLRALYHSTIDTRIKGIVLMVTGTPLPEIMAYSDLDTVRALRAKQMENAGITTTDEYLALTKKYNKFNLETLLCKRKASDYYMFIANDDNWVPTPYQWNLWRVLGWPKREKFGLGHVGTPVFAGIFQLNRTLRFFQERWNPTTVSVQK